MKNVFLSCLLKLPSRIFPVSATKYQHWIHAPVVKRLETWKSKDALSTKTEVAHGRKQDRMKFKLLIDQLNTSETKTRPRLPQISAIFDKSDLNKSVSLLLILYEKHQSAEITKSISTVGSGSKLCEEITRQKSYLSTIFREFISKVRRKFHLHWSE